MDIDKIIDKAFDGLDSLIKSRIEGIDSYNKILVDIVLGTDTDIFLQNVVKFNADTELAKFIVKDLAVHYYGKGEFSIQNFVDLFIYHISDYSLKKNSLIKVSEEIVDALTQALNMAIIADKADAEKIRKQVILCYAQYCMATSFRKYVIKYFSKFAEDSEQNIYDAVVNGVRKVDIVSLLYNELSTIRNAAWNNSLSLMDYDLSKVVNKVINHIYASINGLAYRNLLISEQEFSNTKLAPIFIAKMRLLIMSNVLCNFILDKKIITRESELISLFSVMHCHLKYSTDILEQVLYRLEKRGVNLQGIDIDPDMENEMLALNYLSIELKKVKDRVSLKRIMIIKKMITDEKYINSNVQVVTDQKLKYERVEKIFSKKVERINNILKAA